MAKAIMIQGTASSAGKSLICAGLCRIFREDGFRVAPFKAQNMALNSYITKEGLEMGRAQVMQAEAAGIEPSVLMNPILLKPNSDMGSQVIVAGEVLGNMSAKEYFAFKKSLIPQIKSAYEALAAENDIIVIEGAGSPAEINLKEDDIVNMGMAKMAEAPVLLVGDIDRGGVFAALAGTMLLLEKEEKAIVKGLVINKFRGDRQILLSGEKMIENITKVPVVGVVPFMDIALDDEDSLTNRLRQNELTGIIDIAIIRLPKISNFTDFNPLEHLAGISVRYVEELAQLKKPDLIILPGSKNTMADLIWLRQSGLEKAIQKLAAEGHLVLGICGGFQMLGQKLYDPANLENGGSMRAMALLPMETVFAEKKTRTNVTGHICVDEKTAFGPMRNARFSGYEIHLGQSYLLDQTVKPFGQIETCFAQPENRVDGLCKDNIAGTYIHGLFEEHFVTDALAALLYQRKGISPSAVQFDWRQYKEKQYQYLADQLRQSLDMEKIYGILEAGV